MGSKKDPQRNEVLEKDFRSAHSQLSTLTMALKCPLPCFLFMTGFHLAFQGPAWLLSLPPEFSFLPILSIHSCYQINCHLIPTLTSTLPPSFSLLKPPSCFTPHLVSWFSALILLFLRSLKCAGNKETQGTMWLLSLNDSGLDGVSRISLGLRFEPSWLYAG